MLWSAELRGHANAGLAGRIWSRTATPARRPPASPRPSNPPREPSSWLARLPTHSRSPADARSFRSWSRREDLNLRPPASGAGALPGCATARRVLAESRSSRTPSLGAPSVFGTAPGPSGFAFLDLLETMGLQPTACRLQGGSLSRLSYVPGVGELRGTRTRLAGLKARGPHPKSSSSMVRPARVELASPTVAPSRSALLELRPHENPQAFRRRAGSPQSRARTTDSRTREHVRGGGRHLPHPSCQRAFRLPGRHAGAVREQPPLTRTNWCPTRDLNPDQPASEAGAYADSASGARSTNKKPGDLAAHPGFRLEA